MEWELGLGQDVPAGAVDHSDMRQCLMGVNAPRGIKRGAVELGVKVRL